MQKGEYPSGSTMKRYRDERTKDEKQKKADIGDEKSTQQKKEESVQNTSPK